jgi:diguanylate cyclase (GGDEF)-like protein
VARKILVVDDSPDIQALLKVRLRGERADLVQTLESEKALDLALTHSPDLVLLDVDMPGVTGFEVCKRLKANPKTAMIPVIFLSGKLDQATKVEGLDLGAVDYVTKPFDPVELRARVRSALRIKHLQDQLIALARIDELTGLWNRAYLDSRLDQELASSRRSGLPLSLIMLDADHFKRINDNYGHAAGDTVLRAIGLRVQATLRRSDVGCRYGGEEFVLLLPGVDSVAACIAAERVRTVMKETPIESDDVYLTVTVSLGVVATDDLGPDAATSRSLLECADAALYEAKRSGRDKVCRYIDLRASRPA